MFTNRFRVLKITRERLQKDPLSQKVVDTIIHQLPKRVSCTRVGERSVLLCPHVIRCQRKYVLLLQ